jgi:hypothetical protein
LRPRCAINTVSVCQTDLPQEFVPGSNIDKQFGAVTELQLKASAPHLLKTFHGFARVPRFDAVEVKRGWHSRPQKQNCRRTLSANS